MLQAQNGTTCQTATLLSVDSICSFTTHYFEPGQTQKWTTFNSFSNKTNITLAANNNLSVAYIDSFALFTGNCNNLQYLQSYYLSQFDMDSTFNIRIYNLTPGQTYYITFYKTATPGDEFFDICTTYPPIPPGNPPCPAPGVCENILANGGFDYNFINNYNPVDPFNTIGGGNICYWEVAWGTPQVHSATPSSPPRYAAMWANNVDGEAIGTDVNILPGVPYWLGYRARAFVGGGQNIAMANLTLMLTNSNQTLLPFGGSTIPIVIPGGSQIISTTGQLPFTQIWSDFGACFTPNSPDWNQLIVFPQNAPLVGQSWANIDDISITRLDDAGPNAIYACGIPVQIGPPCVIPGATYTWSPATGLSNPNIPNPFASPTQTTTYTLTITTPNGACTVSSTVTVIVFPPLQVQLAGPYTICKGQSVTIQAPLVTGGTPSYTYLWTPGNLTTPSITVSPTVTTTYTFTVTDGNGCTATASITVFVHQQPPAPVITGPNPSCAGLTWCISNFNPNYTYAWSAPNAVSVTPTPNGQCADIIWNNAGGWITVTVTDLNGCTNTGTFYVNECCEVKSPEPGMTINLVNQTASWLIANYPGFFTFIPVPTFNQSSAYLNINGTFTIDVPHIVFQLIPNIFLGENAEINYVGNAEILEFRNCTLQACGDKMWERIHIPNASCSLTVGGYLIMDGKFSVWSDNGGKIRALNNTFKLNRTCIQIEPYNQLHQSLIANNQFIGTAPLKIPHTGLRTNIGVNINKVISNSPVGGITVGPDNFFTDMNIGVNSIESQTFIHRNTFTNINISLGQNPIAAINASGHNLQPGMLPYLEVGGSNANGNTIVNCIRGVNCRNAMNVKISHNQFTNVNTGIYYTSFSNFMNTSTVNIHNNTLQNNGTGIYSYLNYFTNAYIYSNTIQTNSSLGGIGIRAEELGGLINPNRTQIFANTIKGVTRGVWLQNMEETKVDLNTIQVKPTGMSFFPVRGVEANNCFLVSITNNDIKATPNTSNTWVGGILVSLSPRTTIKCNTVQNLGFGIRCAGGMQPSVVYNNTMKNCYNGFLLTNQGVIGQQGANNQPSYNRWQGSFTNAMRTEVATDGSLSQFYVRSSPPFYTPNPNNSLLPSIPITLNPTGGSQFAPPCSAIVQPPNLIRQQVAQNNIQFIANDTSAKWLTRYALFRELTADTVLLADTILANFYSNTSGTNMDKLENVIDPTRNPLLCNPINLANANADCNTLIAQNLVETTAKEFAQICINKHLLQQTYTPQQINDLKTIAELCPYTHGYAVYLARTVLAEFDTVFVEYLNACEEYNEENMGRFAGNEEEHITYNTAMEENWRIYPVPTNNYLFVSTDADIKPNTKIFLYNLIGKVIKELPIYYNLTQLSTDNLPSGMYYITITRDGSILYNSKAIVIR